jgi:transcriptional regulator with XRE-family HTH domain
VTERAKWSEVRDARLRDATSRKRYDAARQRLDADLALHRRTLGELRKARALTQQQLARSLRVSQAQVSRIESQADLYLSTLRSYVEAMGGELELRVVFGDGAGVDVALGAEEPGTLFVFVEDGVARRYVRRREVVRLVQPHAAGGWEVLKPGASRPSALAATKSDAVRRAEEIVRKGGGGEVVVHAKASGQTVRRVAGAAG